MLTKNSIISIVNNNFYLSQQTLTLRSGSTASTSAEPQPGTSKDDEASVASVDEPAPAPQAPEESRAEALQAKVMIIYIVFRYSV